MESQISGFELFLCWDHSTVHALTESVSFPVKCNWGCWSYWVLMRFKVISTTVCWPVVGPSNGQSSLYLSSSTKVGGRTGRGHQGRDCQTSRNVFSALPLILQPLELASLAYWSLLFYQESGNPAPLQGIHFFSRSCLRSREKQGLV